MAVGADTREKLMSIQLEDVDAGEPVRQKETNLQMNRNSPLVYLTRSGLEIPGFEPGDTLVLDIYQEGVWIHTAAEEDDG